MKVSNWLRRMVPVSLQTRLAATVRLVEHAMIMC